MPQTNCDHKLTKSLFIVKYVFLKNIIHRMHFGESFNESFLSNRTYLTNFCVMQIDRKSFGQFARISFTLPERIMYSVLI